MLMLLFTSCNNKEAGGLRFNLQKGKIYEYQTNFKMKQVEGDSLVSDVSSSYSMEVLDETSGIKTIRVSYKDFLISMEAGSQVNDSIKMERKDFTSMAQDLFNTAFKAMKDKSIVIRVNAKGKITEVEGLTEIIKPILDTMSISPMARTMGLQIMQSDMGKKMIAGAFSQGFEIFPNKEVKLGDTWEREIQLNGLLPISTNTVFTVQAIEGNKVTLDAKSLLTNNNRKGEVLSTYLVDSRTGLVLEARIRTMFGVPPMVRSEGIIKGKEL